MAKLNCSSCEDLRQDAPSFIVNGFTDDECLSLQNNTGLNPSSGNDDCTDLNNMNDCLVGNMAAEVDSYEVCDWKTFMKKFIPNLWSTLKGIICAICGLWTNVSNLWTQVNALSYLGILTLYTDTKVVWGGSTAESAEQTPAFNKHILQGNIPDGVLTNKSNYKGIIVNNTTSVPLLVETTFNCSITTEQHIACCYIVVTRDGDDVGQTPFITPDTYDQQVTAEPFILQPNETAEMAYHFVVGSKNSWYQSEFGYMAGGSGTAKCTLEKRNATGVKTQGSYLSVRVSSIVSADASASV